MPVFFAFMAIGALIGGCAGATSLAYAASRESVSPSQRGAE
jgi:hypothetical protein